MIFYEESLCACGWKSIGKDPFELQFKAHLADTKHSEYCYPVSRIEYDLRMTKRRLQEENNQLKEAFDMTKQRADALENLVMEWAVLEEIDGLREEITSDKNFSGNFSDDGTSNNTSGQRDRERSTEQRGNTRIARRRRK